MQANTDTEGDCCCKELTLSICTAGRTRLSQQEGVLSTRPDSTTGSLTSPPAVSTSEQSERIETNEVN